MEASATLTRIWARWVILCVPVLFLLDSEVETREVTYSGAREPMTTDKTELITAADVLSGKATVEEMVAQLSVEELAELCVGTARMSGGSVIGSASYNVPGAAGDTSSVRRARGTAPAAGLQNRQGGQPPARRKHPRRYARALRSQVYR